MENSYNTVVCNLYVTFLDRSPLIYTIFVESHPPLIRLASSSHSELFENLLFLQKNANTNPYSVSDTKKFPIAFYFSPP